MANTVIGFFDQRSEAEDAVAQLKSAGFNEQDIDISYGSSDQMAGTSGTSTLDSDGYDSNDGTDRHKDNDNKGSGLTRFFNSLFGDDSEDAKKYNHVSKTTGSIVTVYTDSEEEAEDAADILDASGAVDIDERYSTDSANYSRDGLGVSGSNAMNEGNSYSSNTEDKIERIEEELQVGKRTIETGGVRLRSRIVNKPVEENIRLRQEHVRVERQPVDRPVSSSEWNNFEEKEIEITEHAEIPVVKKEARVVEEIRVTKDVEETDETIRDTVRETEVDIDDQRTTGKQRTMTGSNETDRFYQDSDRNDGKI
jgi:uncharacterized protein (TIGR02271 family)